MAIGALSRRTAVKVPTIRYYEEIGLLPTPPRGGNGRRLYGEAAVDRLGFIRRARDLGFATAEIVDLLGLWRDRSRQSADVKRIAENHVAALQTKIRELQEMADTLAELAHCCHGDHRPDCPILDRLETPENDTPATIRPRPGAVARSRP